MQSTPILQFAIIGQLLREFIITPSGKPIIDGPGGSLLYAAGGLAMWEKHIGLVSKVGEDYPQEWIEQAARYGFDVRGITILPQSIDLRSFCAYLDMEKFQNDNPVSHYARLDIPFPKALLGYIAPIPRTDSRSLPALLTIRAGDLPGDYNDITSYHLCPMDFLTHTLLPASLRGQNASTITIDAGPGYMSPTFWDDIPSVVKDITAFFTSELKIRNLFEGRSTDLWEMAETIGSYGCDIVIIKRKTRGQMVYETARRKKWAIPAYPSRVANPTGAGDAFCGGFLAGYRSTYEPLDAALYGNISASFIIEGNGPFYVFDTLPGLAKARLESLQSAVIPV